MLQDKLKKNNTHLICIFMILVITINFSTSYLSLIDEKQTKTPTTSDVNNLVKEFQASQKQDEYLYLIYFDSIQDFNSFLDIYTVKMAFRGLEGVVVKTTPSKISEMTEKLPYLKFNNIHRIINTERNYIMHSKPDTDLSIDPKIQTLATAEQIGVDKMWEQGYLGQKIKIGIFDTGVAANHPDFYFPNGTSRVISEIFVNTSYGNEVDGSLNPDLHGTHVAGIAAGGGIVSETGRGMSNESLIYNADFDYNTDDGSAMDVTLLGEIAAINWAIENGVHIINKSYGESYDVAYWSLLLDPAYQAYIATHRQAIKKGIIFTHSAGNEGSNEFTISADNYIGEISVGASSSTMMGIPNFSSRGPIWGVDAVGPDVVAPGQGISSCSVSGGYTSLDGTSMAAPHVAGGIAVLLSALQANDIDYNPGTIKAALMATAQKFPDYDVYDQGNGQINISAAFDYIMSAPIIGNHPLIGVTNPKNLDFDYFPKILTGTDYSTHFTFVSSECKNVTITTSGTIAPFLSFTESLLVNSSDHLGFENVNLQSNSLPEFYSHNIILSIKVPDDTSIGTYSGTIDFKVNETSLYQLPIEFDIGAGQKKILVYTGNCAEYPFTFEGKFRDMFLDLSSDGYVLHINETDLTSDMLANYDALWIAGGNRTYSYYHYNAILDAILIDSTNTDFSLSEQEAVSQFLEAGGGVFLSPYSTPLGVESLINKWGISTSEIPIDMSSAPCELWHSNPIGLTLEYIEVSGSYFSVEAPAMPLAYQDEREKTVMASYDDPSGGRAIIMSGTDFITNNKYQGTTESDILIRDIINWITNDEQLFGTYKVNNENIDFTLHVSDNGAPVNNADIVGSHLDVLTNTTNDITSQIPSTGTNGWYNFTFTLVNEGIDTFNFSWNSEFVSFEIITDYTIPKIKFSGLENNSIITKDTEVLFWFYDLESGINKHKVNMTLDENRIGFNGPLENKTGLGYYIEKMIYIENYGLGKHVLSLTVQDLVGNSASIKIIFTMEIDTGEKASKKNPGFEWNLFVGLAIVSLILFRKYSIKHLKKK